MMLEQYWHYIAGGLGLILLSYAVVRVASFAHYRTKLEYFRKLKNEVGGGTDGES